MVSLTELNIPSSENMVVKILRMKQMMCAFGISDLDRARWSVYQLVLLKKVEVSFSHFQDCWQPILLSIAMY